jgi:hypothetical protein
MLATYQRLTNRTRYFHTKWHQFWDVIKRGNIKIIKVESAEQQANYPTLGLICEMLKSI